MATTPQGPAVEIRGLAKAYGRTGVLRSLDLDVRWGDALALLGPNGSGKTTLVKILATLTRYDSGIVRIAGLDLEKQASRIRRTVGVVTHEPLLYEHLSGYENLRFYARMFGLDDVDTRISRAAERMGVAGRVHQRVATLSHGLQKRLSIARALLHDPALLLMDEPESGLDQEALTLLEAVVRESADAGRVVILTTHNVERALALGRRLAILARGAIVHDEAAGAFDSAEALREAYARYAGATE